MSDRAPIHDRVPQWALAIAFYTVAIGVIPQVLVGLEELIRFDADAILSRLDATTFVIGVAIMFVLEDGVVEGWLLPG
ncbi:hypothetical protein [Halosolutus halophilus]|uniref:hypothetical protein n=1 Tax=Halosolutus halophilus TaxID=1552990 RepID=UPI0022351049|nr:hypothetical protein [Halosolutus halophilus]